MLSAILRYALQKFSTLPNCEIIYRKELAVIITVITIARMLMPIAVFAFEDIFVSPPLDKSANRIPSTPQTTDTYAQHMVDMAMMLMTTAASVIAGERLSVRGDCR